MEMKQKKSYERPLIKPLNTGMANKFGNIHSHRPTRDIDDIPVKRLLEDHGSPLFVISERNLRNTYREAYAAFSNRYPKVQFAWSYKTNYLDAVCRIFHQEGSWAEVVSGFEYDKALHNGVPGEQILFNGPDKSDSDLLKAMSHRSMIHIDHLDELYSLVRLARESGIRPRVAIRVNMDTGIYPTWDRFGFSFEAGQAHDAINKIIHSGEMDLIGLHCHIGTYILSTEAYAIAATKLGELARFIHEKHGKTVRYIDLGGGFASRNTLRGTYHQGVDVAPSFQDYAEKITTALLNAGFRQGEFPMLILETGRALVDDAGYLLSTVLASKQLSDGRRATILDAGVHLLFTSFWYDHTVTTTTASNGPGEDTVLYGPLCMNIDVVRESIRLPSLSKGDAVVIHRVGAYNMTQWMQFIHMRPAIILIDTEGKVHRIREKETLEDILRMEHLPAHIQS